MPPRIYKHEDHNIRSSDIDEDAAWAVLELKRHGHTAYIVGGSIRDLLLGKIPKDFDISTSARPEQIKAIFQRRCLIIGKRFRLAHLRFRDGKIIEVSTFRAATGQEDDGLITRDNVWGTEEDDVIRRDFTMNALYYDPETASIIDYVSGVEDVSKKLIRVVGDPATRFRQDPVRMLRLIKFLARFDLTVEPRALEAMQELQEEITKSSPARIYEELLKMMELGASRSFFSLLDKFGFLQLLLPSYNRYLNSEMKPLCLSYLQAVDHLVELGYKNVFDRSVYLSSLLFPVIEHEILEMTRAQNRSLKMGQVLHLTEQCMHELSETAFPHFPKKLLLETASLLVHQFRVTPLKGSVKFSLKFPSDQEFQQTLVFLSVRASIDPSLSPLWQAWSHEYERRALNGREQHTTTERTSVTSGHAAHRHSHQRRGRRHASLEKGAGTQEEA